jgi:hypothetical protein
MAGVLGLVASRVNRAPARNDSPPASTVSGTGLSVAGLASLGLFGTAAEAGALHFRGAFQNPFMYAPVIVPPVTAAALATAARRRSPAARVIARSLLHLTAWLGIAGTGFHAWSIHRRMGGWRNWSQNVLAGAPLPAPPAFSGLALAGLAALHLLEPRAKR